MEDARTTRIALEKHIYTMETLVDAMDRTSNLTSAPKHCAQEDRDSSQSVLFREWCQWNSCAEPHKVLDCYCRYGDQKRAHVLELQGLLGKETTMFDQN
jgi:hypothetical protein